MGLVLVFDMDQTILDSSDPYLFQRPPTPEARVILKRKIRDLLNWNVVNIIKRASALRPSGQVTAICLLTNNSSHILVSAVDEVLYEETGSKGKYNTYPGNANDRDMPPRSEPYFFDSIMMRQHSSRPKTIDDNPPKRLVDVLNMLKFAGISDAGLDSMKDIYFFDDIGTHDLRAEFNFISEGKYRDHYIQITPPFRKIVTDRTNYEPILRALSNIDGRPAVLERRGPVITVYRLPRQRNNGPPSAVPPPSTSYRARSNAGVNEYNLNLPPLAEQEQSIRRKPITTTPSLMGAFAPRGGSRKTRTRHRRRRFTRRRK